MSCIDLRQGDCVELLRELPDASVDCALTDPPYASGGICLRDRQRLEVIFEPGVGLIPGTYLVFVYALAVGTVQDVYVDVSALVDIYRAGCGIDISASREVSVKLHPEGAIKCDPVSGLGVSPGAGLTLKDNNFVLDLGTGEDSPIVINPDGSIGIDCSKLLSADSDNVLRLGSDKKLKVVVVSADKDNLLVSGSDKGAYTPMDRGDMPTTR